MKANYKNLILSTLFFSFSVIFSSANVNEKNDSNLNINSSFEITNVDDATNMLFEEPIYDSWSGFEGENGFTPSANQFIQTAEGAQITLSGNLEIAGLLLGADSELILNGYELIINEGNIETLGGLIDATDINSAISFRGTSAQVFDGLSMKDQELSKLLVDNPTQLSLNNALKINNLLKVNSGSLDLTAANLTMACKFNAGSIKTAQIDQVPAASEILGNLEVEQCFEARRAFRFVGSPVNSDYSVHTNWQEGASSYTDNPKPGYGTHITGLGNVTNSSENDMTNGFDWNPSGNSSMFVWDTNNQVWGQVNNTNQTNLTAGNAYRVMLRGDRSTDITTSFAAPTSTKLRTQGAPALGTVDVSHLFTEIEGDYAFVANPYQAVVDLRQVYQDASNIEETALIWDPWLGGIPTPGQPGGRGAWINYNMSTGVSSNTDSEFNGFLQPYQAVVLRTKANAVVDVKFKEEHKNIDELSLQTFSEAQPTKTLQTQLYTEDSFNAGSTSSDAFVIHFTEDGYNGLDHRDAPKMDNVDENLARFFNGNLLSVENRAFPQTGENLTLFINQFSCLDYTFKFTVPVFDSVLLKLKDNYTGELHDLSAGVNMVNFSVNGSNASKAFNRFSFEFHQVTLSSTNFENENAISMYPNPVQSDYLYVELPQNLSGDISVEIFDVQGRKVNAKVYENQTSNSLKIKNLNLNSGVYFLNIKGEQKLNTTVKFIKA